MERYTLSGLAAILLWSTTIAFARAVSEELGSLAAGGMIYTLAGILGVGLAAWQKRGLGWMRSLPWRYWVVCGGLFVGYMVCLYAALGLAQTRAQTLVVGLVNYLWPALILAFSVPLLGLRARPWLGLGLLLALGGVLLAMTGGEQVNWAEMAGGASAYGVMLCGAVCWALYTNLGRLWLGDQEANGVPFFLLASGLALAGLAAHSQKEVLRTAWTLPLMLNLLYLALGPGWLAYTLWDVGTRRGQIIFLAAVSYFTPLLSTVVSILVLDTPAPPALWLGAGLVIAGAVVCNRALS